MFLIYYYGTILLVLLLIIDIIYVTYCFQIKKFNLTWPLYLLRNVTGLMVTVFFLPIAGIYHIFYKFFTFLNNIFRDNFISIGLL